MPSLITKHKMIRNRLEKQCALCGKGFKVILYSDRTYKGGKYFFKIPICSKKEEEKSLKAGIRKERFLGNIINVRKYEPKPYKFVEYWECNRCFNKNNE